MESVNIECPSCGGTGLYHGMAEPKGVGVVCLSCEGTGCRKYQYTPFTGRKRRDDIVTVQRSRGTFIFTGCGPVGESISYEDFLNGEMP